MAPSCKIIIKLKRNPTNPLTARAALDGLRQKSAATLWTSSFSDSCSSGGRANVLLSTQTYFWDGAGVAIDGRTSGLGIGEFIVVKIPVVQTIPEMGSRRGVFSEHIRGSLEQGNPRMLKAPVVGRLYALPPPPCTIPCACVQCKNVFPLSGWNKDRLFYHGRIEPLDGDITQHPQCVPPPHTHTGGWSGGPSSTVHDAIWDHHQ